ncbi:hypothetical protein ACFFLZ_22195 [Photobacterium aphoticum]|uniref:hypothetical protein n=1 Tax=Photobacterium aphoticum TaxID=754436 RepID=UPI000B05CF92|nr:hypothetical protein [Photobacterium aphoticum]
MKVNNTLVVQPGRDLKENKAGVMEYWPSDWWRKRIACASSLEDLARWRKKKT